MIFSWILILSTAQVPNLNEEMVSFIFHWIAEFGTAGSLIIAGILTKSKHHKQKEVQYFAFGLLLNATLGMVVYYIIFTEIVFIIVGFIIIPITILLARKNYEDLRELYFLMMGTVIYGLLNILGIGARELELSILIYLGMALFFSIIILIISFIKEINIK